MLSKIKVTALFATAILLTGCGLMKTSSQMVAEDHPL